MKEQKYVAAVDIGGTNTRVACLDESLNIIHRQSFSTDAQNPEEAVRKIVDAIAQLPFPVQAIGVGSPGPINLKEGILLSPPNLPGWWNFALKEEIEKASGMPCFVEGDANLAGLSESVMGNGKDHSICVFMTISTGIGGGLIIDKKVFQGAHGSATELANSIVWSMGPHHGSLKEGAIEAISSGTAIVNRARILGYDVEHAGQVADLAKTGDIACAEIIEDAMEYLANLIAIIYGIIDPDIVVLGGSVALKIEGFIENIEKRVKNKVYPHLSGFVNLVPAKLGDDSGLVGAGYLALSNIEN
jgi:glucokinase